MSYSNNPTGSSPSQYGFSVRSSGPTPGPSSTQSEEVIYVADLPYTARQQLTDLLDADGYWRELGGKYLDFNQVELKLLENAIYQKFGSCTADLLMKWEKRNPKITLLYHYLSCMNHHRAMALIAPFLPNSYPVQKSDLNIPILSVTAPSPISPYSMMNPYNHRSPDARHYRHEHAYPPSSHSPVQQNEEQPQSHVPYGCGFNAASEGHKEVNKLPAKIRSDPRSSRMDQYSVSSSQIEEGMELAYKELEAATDDFAESRILGKGGFGTVYKGYLKGTEVAIKRIARNVSRGPEDINLTQAMNEMRILNRYRIDNILPLYGISSDGPHPCVVYQLMPNGSLDDRLRCKDNSIPLTWIQRMKVGEGVAKGLTYLHTLKGEPIVHGDVKSANILLDSQFSPKLGDFGLSRQIQGLGVSYVEVTSVQGTSAYLPLEYLTMGVLSPAVDVYSFGIVLLEMATGERAMVNNERLTDYANKRYPIVGDKLIDPKLGKDNRSIGLFRAFFEIGNECANEKKKKRPPMKNVLSDLVNKREELEVAEETDEDLTSCESVDSNLSHEPPIPQGATGNSPDDFPLPDLTILGIK